jgi:hypothetical protein
MSARAPEVAGGLAVTSLHGKGDAWYVVHAASGKSVFGSGYLRQRRFADQARADLLATGADFCQDARAVHGQRERWAPVARVWTARGRQDEIDWRTGEHYSASTHYGQVIPSAAHAKRLAAALESYVWS